MLSGLNSPSRFDHTKKEVGIGPSNVAPMLQPTSVRVAWLVFVVRATHSMTTHSPGRRVSGVHVCSNATVSGDRVGTGVGGGAAR